MNFITFHFRDLTFEFSFYFQNFVFIFRFEVFNLSVPQFLDGRIFDLFIFYNFDTFIYYFTALFITLLYFTLLNANTRE